MGAAETTTSRARRGPRGAEVGAGVATLAGQFTAVEPGVERVQKSWAVRRVSDLPARRQIGIVHLHVGIGPLELTRSGHHHPVLFGWVLVVTLPELRHLLAEKRTNAFDLCGVGRVTGDCDLHTPGIRLAECELCGTRIEARDNGVIQPVGA